MQRILTILCFMLCSFTYAYAGASATTDPVNLNQANVKQLMTLKGIGKKRAQAIIAYREAHGGFHQVNDLLEVPGISKNLFDKVQQQNPNRMMLK